MYMTETMTMLSYTKTVLVAEIIERDYRNCGKELQEQKKERKNGKNLRIKNK